MSTIPELLERPSLGPAPAQVELSTANDLEPLSIVATFDGSGAGGAFLPCCSLYSPSGTLLSRTFPGQVSAGDVATVTFAPFLEEAQAASAPAGNVMNYYTTTGSVATSGAGLTQMPLIGWGGPNDGVAVGLDGAGNPEIEASGVFAFHVVAGPTVLNPNVDTTLVLELTRITGTGGQFSSRYSGGPQGFADWAARINQAGTGIDINAQGQGELFAFGVWETLDTFPSAVRFRCDVLENLASVVRTVNYTMTVVQLGASFV